MTALPTLLTGDGAYANVRDILKGIELRQLGVRPDIAPHSIYEELWHMLYWQDLLLEWTQGSNRAMPLNLDESWPKSQAPESVKEARDMVRRFLEGVNRASALGSSIELDKIVLEKYTVRSLLETLLAHNSYHLARIVFLRQLIGIWSEATR